MLYPKRAPAGRRGGGKLAILAVLAVSFVASAIYFSFWYPRAHAPSIHTQPEQLVQAEFMADSDAVVPGREFFIGVRFRIAPDWYIYWKDPGDAGMPTTVDLTVPEGFVKSPILYPAPVRFTQPGNIVSYVYANETMLLAKVTPPAELLSGQSVTLRAHARWLSCRDKCVQGELRFEKQMPVAPDAQPVHEQIFSIWKKQIPPEQISRIRIGSLQMEWMLWSYLCRCARESFLS